MLFARAESTIERDDRSRKSELLVRTGKERKVPKNQCVHGTSKRNQQKKTKKTPHSGFRGIE